MRPLVLVDALTSMLLLLVLFERTLAIEETNESQLDEPEYGNNAHRVYISPRIGNDRMIDLNQRFFVSSSTSIPLVGQNSAMLNNVGNQNGQSAMANPAPVNNFDQQNNFYKDQPAGHGNVRAAVNGYNDGNSMNFNGFSEINSQSNDKATHQTFSTNGLVGKQADNLNQRPNLTGYNGNNEPRPPNNPNGQIHNPGFNNNNGQRPINDNSNGQIYDTFGFNGNNNHRLPINDNPNGRNFGNVGDNTNRGQMPPNNLNGRYNNDQGPHNHRMNPYKNEPLGLKNHDQNYQNHDQNYQNHDQNYQNHDQNYQNHAYVNPNDQHPTSNVANYNNDANKPSYNNLNTANPVITKLPPEPMREDVIKNQGQRAGPSKEQNTRHEENQPWIIDDYDRFPSNGHHRDNQNQNQPSPYKERNPSVKPDYHTSDHNDRGEYRNHLPPINEYSNPKLPNDPHQYAESHHSPYRYPYTYENESPPIPSSEHHPQLYLTDPNPAHYKPNDPLNYYDASNEDESTYSDPLPAPHYEPWETHPTLNPYPDSNYYQNPHYDIETHYPEPYSSGYEYPRGSSSSEYEKPAQTEPHYDKPWNSASSRFYDHYYDTMHDRDKNCERHPRYYHSKKK